MPDPARQLVATLMNPLFLNGGRPPTVVTGNYTMRKDDGWIVVFPQLASGTIQIQLPADPDPGSVYFVTRIAGAVEPSAVDVVVVGNTQQSATGYDTIYVINAAGGGYHIARINETVGFAVSSQQPNFVPHPYTDWFVFGGLGLEQYSAAFVPNLAGAVTVPLTGFAPIASVVSDGGHPRTLYGLAIAVAPALSAGSLTVTPRFNGVNLEVGPLALSSATQPAASRLTAGSPIAGPGVNFFTGQPGGLVIPAAPAAGAVLDVTVTGAGGAAGPTAGVVTALLF